METALRTNLDEALLKKLVLGMIIFAGFIAGTLSCKDERG